MIGDVASDNHHVVWCTIGHVQPHCFECIGGVIGEAAFGHLAIFEEMCVGKLSDTNRRWARGSCHSLSLARTASVRPKQSTGHEPNRALLGGSRTYYLRYNTQVWTLEVIAVRLAEGRPPTPESRYASYTARDHLGHVRPTQPLHWSA